MYEFILLGGFYVNRLDKYPHMWVMQRLILVLAGYSCGYIWYEEQERSADVSPERGFRTFPWFFYDVLTGPLYSLNPHVGQQLLQDSLWKFKSLIKSTDLMHYIGFNWLWSEICFADVAWYHSMKHHKTHKHLIEFRAGLVLLLPPHWLTWTGRLIICPFHESTHRYPHFYTLFLSRELTFPPTHDHWITHTYVPTHCWQRTSWNRIVRPVAKPPLFISRFRAASLACVLVFRSGD